MSLRVDVRRRSCVRGSMMAGWLSFVGARREDEQTFTIEQPVIFFLYEIKPAQQTTERPQIDAPPTPEKRKKCRSLNAFLWPWHCFNHAINFILHQYIIFIFIFIRLGYETSSSDFESSTAPSLDSQDQDLCRNIHSELVAS